MQINHLPRSAGTFVISCHTGEKVLRFVGYSTNLRIHLKNTRLSLRKGVSCSRLLQDAWNEHGEDAFDVELICEKDQVADMLAQGKFELNIYKYLSPAKHPKDKTSVSLHRPHEESDKLTAAIIAKVPDEDIQAQWGISLGNLNIRKWRLRQKGFSL